MIESSRLPCVLKCPLFFLLAVVFRSVGLKFGEVNPTQARK